MGPSNTCLILFQNSGSFQTWQNSSLAQFMTFGTDLAHVVPPSTKGSQEPKAAQNRPKCVCNLGIFYCFLTNFVYVAFAGQDIQYKIVYSVPHRKEISCCSYISISTENLPTAWEDVGREGLLLYSLCLRSFSSNWRKKFISLVWSGGFKSSCQHYVIPFLTARFYTSLNYA